jgi:predicted ATPase
VTATRGYASPEILDLYTRARTLCGEIDETASHFDVLEGLFVYHYVSADLATARAVGDQLLAIASRASDGTQLLRAHTALGCTTVSLGEWPTARDHLNAALTFHDPERHIRLMTAMGADPGIISLVYLGWTLDALGYTDQGFAAAQRAFTLGQVRPHSFSMAWGLMAMAFAHLWRGAMTEVLEAADALITLSREQDFATWLAFGKICRAAALSWVDSPAKAIPLLKNAIESCLATGNLIFRPVSSTALVGAYLRAGEVEAGVALAAELLAHSEQTGDRQAEISLWQLRGQLLLAGAKRDENEAELSLRKALAVARYQHSKLGELTAGISLAQLWQRQGRREAARELLEPIYAWFTEGFGYPELRNAQALLDALSEP